MYFSKLHFGDNSTIQDIDDIWLEEFRAYLLQVDSRIEKPRLNSITGFSYSIKSLSPTTAYERRIIERNSANLRVQIPAEKCCCARIYYDGEVSRLVETKCAPLILKDAFLFLRFNGTMMARQSAPHLGRSEGKRNRGLVSSIQATEDETVSCLTGHCAGDLPRIFRFAVQYDPDR